MTPLAAIHFNISFRDGKAIANLKGDLDKQHIAVIGDASIAAGMAFEGLNHASYWLVGNSNDNAIGIDPSVGALKDYCSEKRKEPWAK
jgi:1-deoxy-D-xylulose-5-phosphate synthase